jgi:hypothetical protein
MNEENKVNEQAQTFIKLFRGDITLELMKYPPAFMLLCQIALRARRTDKFNQYNLLPGQALIGDHNSIGLTMKQYRTAKNKLISGNLATFKRAFNGTVATLINKDVFDININDGAIPFLVEGQSKDNQGATNNNVNNEKNTDSRLSTNKKVVFEKAAILEFNTKDSLFYNFINDHRHIAYIKKSVKIKKLFPEQIKALLKFFILNHLRDQEEYKNLKEIFIHIIHWINQNLEMDEKNTRQNNWPRENILFYDMLNKAFTNNSTK